MDNEKTVDKIIFNDTIHSTSLDYENAGTSLT